MSDQKPQFETITSVAALRDLYDGPHEIALKKERQKLDQFSRQYLALSPFALLSTSDREGRLDCSPRGDYPGFIAAIDDSTIALPDRPGNNRIDSLLNIVANPRVGLLCMVPGFSECLRINGSAVITTDHSLLQRFEYQGKLPKSVTVIALEEVYFHCAKAINRARLWAQESQQDRSLMPSLGRIIMAQVNPETPESAVQQIETAIEQQAKTTLY